MACGDFKAMAWSSPVGNIKGPQGNQGQRGSQWFDGNGDPNTLTFSEPIFDGDEYLNGDDGEVWQFNGTTWVDSGVNLTGPQGSQGIPGADGTDGVDGSDGADGSPGQRGSDWFSANRAPTAADEVGKLPGDQWLDTSTGNVYEFV